MKLPFVIPSTTFYSALTYLGLAAVIYAVIVPTDQFDLYKTMLRDIEEERAVLAVEQDYLAKAYEKFGDGLVSDELAERLLEQEKQLAIRGAKLEINERRVQDIYRNWEKSRLWSWTVGLAGILATFTGFYLWRRRELEKNAD
jgi:IS1 family transposase